MKSYTTTLPLLIMFCFSAIMAQAQSVGINTITPDTTAVLDVVSTTKGILIPRMNSGQRTGITLPAIGLLVFDTDTESFWYHQSNGWFELTNGAFTNDSGVVRSTGNHGTDDFVFGSASLPPSTDISDTLVFFDKSKGAFRSGTVYESDAWAPDSIGGFSFSSGYNTIASGILSIAHGYETRSTGQASIAMGENSQATGDNAMAIGLNTRATAISDFASGSNSIASGGKSFATGNNTIASNQNSFASGSTTEANGYASFAAGNYTHADGLVSFSLGQFNVGGGSINTWVPTDPIFEIGVGDADENRKNAMTVLKNGDFIVGREGVPPASPISDTLMFFDKSKGAFRSGALSNSPIWGPDYIGDYSFSAGYNTRAQGQYAVAFGHQTEATGVNSMALGTSSKATGFYSLASGRFTKADAYASAAHGQYNVGGGSTNSWVSTDPIFEIGIGSGDMSRENAMTILKNGDFIVGRENVPPATPITDTLMFFDKSKGAFRFGRVSNSNGWAPDSIGGLSFSAGQDTKAMGRLSAAFGSYTRSFGVGSFTLGELTQATGVLAVATGYSSIASGLASFSTGIRTKADAYSSFALGQYNVGGGSTDNWIITDPLFEVGNGTSEENRKNAMTVLKNGDFIVGREDVPPASAITDTLMFFDKSKGAFRSGALSNSAVWGANAIGSYSFSAGYNTKASGLYAIALGHQTEAIGVNSTAMGTTSKATGFFSLATGRFTHADAYASAAHGQYNVGGGTTNSWVSTDPIFEIGIGSSDMSRKNAMTVLKNGDFIVGREDVPPASAITDTLMFFDKSKGAFRSGLLLNSNAWAPGSLGESSFASGYNTLASGSASFSTGYYTIASGLYSQATGYNTLASNEAAMASGYETEASGYASFATGFSTKAEALASSSLGQFNVGGGTNNSWVLTDPIFEVGNGISDENRQNAMTILKNGNVGIGTSTPGAPLDILSNGNATTPQLKLTESVANDGARIIFNNEIETDNRWTLYGLADNTHASSAFNIFYNGVGNIITAKGDGNVGIKGSPATDLHLFHGNNAGASGFRLENNASDDWFRFYISSSSADLRLHSKSQGATIIGTFDDVTGAYTAVSDGRAKMNFEDLYFNWDDFMHLKPLTYQYKTAPDGKRSIGMVAQDVQSIYPELVKYHEDADLYHLDYAGFGVIAIKAIQEQQKTIEDLRNENQDLALRLNELEEQSRINKDLESRLAVLEKMLAK